VSEYQYFEFRAIDEPLDQRAQRDLRGISSRASITATSFTNIYSWGSLKADPAEMLARWFDAFLHVTNWGTRWLAFRIRRGALTEDDQSPYEVEVFSSQDEGQHTCLHFARQDEDPGDWVDGEEWLGSLLPLRDALGAGDLRCLYLAWLVDVQLGCVDEEEEEPPVPPGLSELDAAHEAFVEFMQVDRDLLAVAAEASSALAPAGPSRDATLAWLAASAARTRTDGSSRSSKATAPGFAGRSASACAMSSAPPPAKRGSVAPAETWSSAPIRSPTNARDDRSESVPSDEGRRRSAEQQHASVTWTSSWAASTRSGPRSTS